MKKIVHNKLFWFVLTAIFSCMFLVSLYQFVPLAIEQKLEDPSVSIDEKDNELDELETKKARAAYFKRILKDPKIDKIPQGIRRKELAFAKELKLKNRFKGVGDFFEWSESGPNDIGGRTRAIGIDRRNSDVVIAGGVSGGIWKTTNGGSTWNLKSDPVQSLSVTSITQDPTNLNTWYYSAGEITGGSTTGIGGGAFLFGTGIFKSVDNGETWQRMPITVDEDAFFSSPFDFVSRIRVNPQTGSVFFSSNGFGIFRSTDGLQSNLELVLGGTGDHLFSDIDIAEDGTLIASLSQADAQAPGSPVEFEPGLYRSINDGQTWTNITPDTYPVQHQRTVVAIAPSSTNIVYAFTHVSGSQSDVDNRLHRINTSNGTSLDLSANIPNSGEPVGFPDAQGSYNLAVEVKPDDPDFVLLGTINLFRSTDGFQTPFQDTNNDDLTDDSESTKFWIGGYDPISHTDGRIGTYPNQHPDQHTIVFDPDNPNRVWVGHDGGISVADDITSTTTISTERAVSWSSRDNGYNVTQFYTVSIPDESSDRSIMGGTQDNGTPFFNSASENGSADISSGDGGFAFFSENFLFVSSQNGNVLRWDRNSATGLPVNGSLLNVTPDDASGQLFIHPYLVDPNDENIMYYPAGDSLWRNTNMSNFSQANWNTIDSATPTEGSFDITALDISTNPAGTLYLGFSPNNDAKPRITKIANANAASIGSSTNITPAAIDTGSFIHNIHVNKIDADEIMVSVSNFEVESVFHTSNGGQSWSSVEGNLASTGNQAGPSVRAAAIVNPGGEKVYVLATSVGVFSTTTLDGENTTWQQESEDVIGNVIVNDLDYRTSDDLLAIGTHGRGSFVGNLTEFTPLEDEGIAERPGKFTLEQNFPNPFNPSTTISYTLPIRSNVELTVFDLQGREVVTLINNQLQAAGSHAFNFNAERLSSGIYFYRLTASPVNEIGSSFTETRKLTLIK